MKNASLTLCNHFTNLRNLDGNIDVFLLWIRYGECRSMRSRVIDRKQKGYRPTDRHTCAKQYAHSSSNGGRGGGGRHYKRKKRLNKCMHYGLPFSSLFVFSLNLQNAFTVHNSPMFLY